MVEDIKLLKNITSHIRKRDIIPAQKVFSILIKREVRLTKEVLIQMYVLGDTFRIYKNSAFFIEAIDSQLEKTPSKFLFLLKLEIMYYSSGDEKEEQQEVLDVCNEAIKKFREFPEFLNMKSNIYSDMGKREKALQYINHALSLHSDNTIFLSNKALLLFELKKKDEALETIERAIGINPSDKDLQDDKRYIEFEGDVSETDIEVKVMKADIEKISNNLNNMKFDFIAIAGIFIAILTIAIRVITFDYNNYMSLPFWTIVKTQLAINSPWLLALAVLILGLAIFLLITRNKKK